MSFDAEVGIVGAGPAGARAAELLASAGADVLVWDPRAPWEKPCGGAFTISAVEHVPELAHFLPRRARRIEVVHLQADESDEVELRLEQPMYTVARATLGRWQLQRAQAAGAVLERTSIREARRLDRGWRVRTAEGGERTVRLLIGADGAASLVRAAIAPGFRPALAPTRVAFVPGPGPTPECMGLRFFGDVAGYAWDFPRPDHRSIGVGLDVGGWARPKMDAEVDRYCAFRGGSGGADFVRAGAVIGTALYPLTDWGVIGGPSFALLGDAAGLADPATGEGIQNALRSAAALAEAYARDRSFEAYPALARAAFDAEFRFSRGLRKVLYAGNLIARLIVWGRRSHTAYSMLVAIGNSLNAHDHRVLREWTRALRSSGKIRRGWARRTPVSRVF